MVSRRPFAPVWWARSGLAQTLVGSWRVHRPRPALRLERWETLDGDFVRLHLGDGREGAPTVLVLHGLEGSVDSAYVRELAWRTRAAGWNFAALEFRSCGGELNRLLRSYHSGETGDLDFVVAELSRRIAGAPLFAVGYSLGANVLLKWLGERGDAVPGCVRAAAAVSAPYDLEICAEQCDLRYGGAIARSFLRTLIPKALAKAAQFPGALDADAVRRCRTFRSFDDLVTAPLHGFADACEYWRTQSCAQFLPAVRRPSLLISAADDPLVPARVWPRAQVQASPWLHEEFSPRGGHAAFVAGGWPLRARRWAEGRVLEWFAQQLEGGAGAPPPG
ncbi:MAG: alpha/beta fold hydrolase [Planctomycetes bacterium]|nr:alpha/beta fold hydrolase [Planctomycetota bacterium]MCB9884128.1 alpha/beta fold hydrolase [Planctomycetota bacterium]